MARHLVLLAHADPSMAPRYVAALDKVEEPVDFVLCNNFVPGKLSAAYAELAWKVKDASGRFLPGLFRRFNVPGAIDDYATITAVSFSAGYALWRMVLDCRADAELIDGVVGIDSWHTGFDADGTAKDSQLGGLVSHAIRSKDGPAVCWLGHTDVKTYGYASTTQVAAEVERLAGGQAGGFRVQAYNTQTDQKKEHGAALTQWGPLWVADAVNTLIQRVNARREPDHDEPEQDTVPSDTLGIRALQIGIADQHAGVREIPGAKHNKRILEYFAGCERDGKCIGPWLNADEYHWCAAFASACCLWAATPGERHALPHRWRASVRELWIDALASGCARAASVVRAGKYVPAPGDLWIGVRGGNKAGPANNPFSATDGKGHVGRLCWFRNSGEFETLDGNSSNTILNVARHVGAPEFVGVIVYPRPDVEPYTPGDQELASARRLIELSDNLARGTDTELASRLFDV